MLLLAHTGITVGAAYFLEQAAKFRVKSHAKTGCDSDSPPISKMIDTAQNQDKDVVIAAPKEPCPAWNKLSSVKVDYRFILLGSMLPLY